MSKMESRSHTNEVLRLLQTEFSDVSWETDYFPKDCVVSKLLDEVAANAFLKEMLTTLGKEHSLYRDQNLVWITESSREKGRYRIVISTENFFKLNYYDEICAFLNKQHSFGPLRWKLFLTNETPAKYRVFYSIPLNQSYDESIKEFLNFGDEKFPKLSDKIKAKLIINHEKQFSTFKILDPVLLNEIHHLAVETHNRTLSNKP